jgi:dUTP pyrophosphatase
LVPSQATPHSVGYDVHSPITTVIPPYDRRCIPLGICMKPPEHFYIGIAARSSLAYNYGIQVDGGVIDADYTGEIGILIFNTTNNPVHIQRGDRIGQLVFEAYGTP